MRQQDKRDVKEDGTVSKIDEGSSSSSSHHYASSVEDYNELRISVSRKHSKTSSTATEDNKSKSPQHNNDSGGLDQEMKQKQASKEAILVLIQSLKALGQV